MKKNYHSINRSRENEKIPAALSIAAGILSAYILWDNLRISVTRYNIEYKNLPRSFDGFKIVQISDLHSARFGKHQSRLVELIRKEAPDMIAITGDLVGDSDMDSAIELLRHITKISSCFYVSGNHEFRTGKYYSVIRPALLRLGVKVLDDISVQITKNNEHISLIGLNDPSFERFGSKTAVTGSKLKNLESGDFTILLSHRPELAEVYSAYNISLALTGHAHGGQFRIPFIKRGVYAPQQGILPKYTSGIVDINNTKTIISRGLGTQTVIPRFNNPPELVVVQLTKSSLNEL